MRVQRFTTDITVTLYSCRLDRVRACNTAGIWLYITLSACSAIAALSDTYGVFRVGGGGGDVTKRGIRMARVLAAYTDPSPVNWQKCCAIAVSGTPRRRRR